MERWNIEAELNEKIYLATPFLDENILYTIYGRNFSFFVFVFMQKKERKNLDGVELQNI